ncbi:MAG: site-specific integrase, partial [Bacteroidales bacterium]|nr:site-specific integrase [Bacteroidales bacterium]
SEARKVTSRYLISTGNRASTVINIKISDIDFDAMTIHLKTVKNRRQQLVPLSPALKDILADYLKTWEWSADDFLFPSYEGTQLNVRSLQCAIAKYNISRSVSKTSIHLFRHTFAKNFILAGGGMVQLQTLLGHSTMDMTRHYVNIYGLDLQRDFAKLNPLDNLMRTR